MAETDALIGKSNNIAKCERENVNALSFAAVKPTLKIRLTLPVSYAIASAGRVVRI